MSLFVLSLMAVISGIWSALCVRRLTRPSSTILWMAVSGALWLATLCWVPFLCARMVGMTTSLYLASGAFVTLLTVELAYDRGALPACGTVLRTAWRQWTTHRSRRWFALALGFALFHAAGHYWHCLRDADGSLWSAGAGWEDQSFHAALATSFALGDNLTRLSYPQVPHWPLGYPFLPDFQAGWLHAQGLSLPAAFWWGNMLASAVFLLAAGALLYRWLGSPGRALLALAVWHLAGGGGILYLWHAWREHGSLASALWAHDYANDWGLELHFHNFVTAILWPMRVALFGLAIACALAALIRDLLSRPTTSLRGFVFAGALAGALPLLSAHGLVVLACAVLPWALHHRPRLHALAWLAAFAVGAVLTIPQLLWMRMQLSQSDPPFVRFAPGWMIGWWGPGALVDILHHWVWNTGVWITLGFVAWCFAGRQFRRETTGWWLILPLGYLIVFQPYIFDNLKLFAAAGLAAAAGCAWLLAEAWRRGLPGKSAATVLAVLMTAAGIQSILSEARAPAVIANPEERNFAARVAAATPPDALILTGSQLNHPVLVLAGRRVVAANPSGLTLHGMPTAFDRTADVAKIYTGAPEADALLASLGPDWLVIGPMERAEFPTLDTAYLARISSPVLSEGPWELRRLHTDGLEP